YYQVVEIIKKHGGCLVNIVGTLRILPIAHSLILYDRLVPKHCLVVDDIEVIHPSKSSQLSTTVSVTFQLYDRMELAKGWTCNTFSPGSSKRNLGASVDWLQNYIRRYSSVTNPMILSDFDEQYEHFTNPVAFPISRIRNNKIDAYRAY